MKRIFLTLMFVALICGVGAILGLQYQETIALREERGLLRAQDRELASVQAENARLKQSHVSPAELERLREDHGAIARLRAELERLKSGAGQPVH